MGFVAEVLHRFEIEQGIDGLGAGLAVLVVHGAAEFGAPFGHRQGPGDIADHRDEGDQREPAVVEPPQDGTDHADLDEGRQNVEQHVAEQGFDAPRAALHSAAYTAGLTF